MSLVTLRLIAPAEKQRRGRNTVGAVGLGLLVVAAAGGVYLKALEVSAKVPTYQVQTDRELKILLGSKAQVTYCNPACLPEYF